jgi:hypothetical protein
MHQSHSRRSTRSRLGKGGYGPLNQFLFSHLKRNPAILSSLPHIFLPPWHGPCNPIRSPSRSRVTCVRAAPAGRTYHSISVIRKRSLNGTFNHFPRKFQDRFRTVSRHRLCFAPGRTRPPSWSFSSAHITRRHGHTTQSCIIKHTTHAAPRSPTLLHPPARPLS